MSLTDHRAFRVVIVDDHAQMRQLLAHTLNGTSEFTVVGEASNGAEAITIVQRLEPDIVLMDLAMPHTDGIEATRTLRALGYPARVVMLTSNADKDAVTKAIEAGADGYVLKGANALELRSALKDVVGGGTVLAPAVARGVVDGYLGLIEEKRRRDLAVIKTLAGAVERRDDVTGDHINNVASLSIRLWRHMTGSEPDEEMVYGFLLHDIGKIEIPDSILLKKGLLTEDERLRMRKHVEIGVELIAPLGFGNYVTDVIRFHHERWDGSGYPIGLKGDQIPLHARLFSVVDSYDAMVASRPYDPARPAAQAAAELQRCSGTQFDPQCVVAMITMLSLA
ncbi:MAG: HD-GYP domain-containing protein [Actinomycetota bacterium]